MCNLNKTKVWIKKLPNGKIKIEKEEEFWLEQEERKKSLIEGKGLLNLSVEYDSEEILKRRVIERLKLTPQNIEFIIVN